MCYVLTAIVIEAHTLGETRTPGIQLSERYIVCTTHTVPNLIKMSVKVIIDILRILLSYEET
jgi:hypothetical protein